MRLSLLPKIMALTGVSFLLHQPVALAQAGLEAITAALASAPDGAPEAASNRATELEAALQRRSMLRGQQQPLKVWDADTVRRLATWLRSPPGAPGPELDRQLLQQDLDRPTGLIVSGGVSLGAYQAGFMYYYTQFLVALREFIDAEEAQGRGLRVDEHAGPSLVTGASAGSINAFLAAVETCRERQKRPETSLFYQTWIPIGLEQLMTETEVQPGALLSRTPIKEAVERLSSLWASPAGWSRRSCHSLVGISVTRLLPRRLNVLDVGKLWVTKQSEKFMLEMDKKPGEDTPTFRPFGPAADEGELIRRLYPRAGTNGALGIEAVVELLKASSSFPLAFSPIKLGYEVFERLPESGDAFKRALDEFIDGGVFDNTPIRLAARMQRWSRGAVHQQNLSTLRLLFLEPDVIGWEPVFVDASPPVSTAPAGGAATRTKGAATVQDPKPIAKSLFDTYQPFIGGFIDSATQAEMIETLQSETEVWRGLEIPRRNMPVASGHFRNFFGFLEEDFRLYDFFSGAADAWQHLAGSSLAFQLMNATGRPVTVESPIFQCLLDWRVERHAGRNVKAAEIDSCSRLDTGMSPDRATNIRALVDATARLRAHAVSPKTQGSPSELQVFLTAIEAGGYRFKNLTYRGDPATPQNATRAIREKVQILIERLGANQPSLLSRMGVETVGKAAANAFEYRPPSFLLGLGATNDTGVELQIGGRVPYVDLPLRLQTALRLSGFSAQVLDPVARPGLKTYLYDASASETLLWEQPVAWPAIFQLEMGAGWQVLWRGRLLPVDRYMWRHGPELLFGATIFQRLFVDITGNYYVGEGGGCTGRNDCGRVSAAHRTHETPLSHSRFQLRGTVGLRLLFN